MVPLKALKDLSELNGCIEANDLAAIATSIAGLTYIYLPVDPGKKPELSSVFSGRYFGRTWLVDVSDVMPGDVLTCDILGDVEDRFLSGDNVLIRTGWHKQHVDKVSYFDKYPVIGLDLVEWMVRNQVNMFLTDSPFLANNNYLPEFNEIYNTLAASNTIVVQGITNLDIIDEESFDLVIMPLKLEHLNLSPVRVVVQF